MRIFGKGKCELIANFSATMVTSLPFFSLSLSHRAHLTHNIESASALPISMLEIEKEILREVARGDKPYLRKSTERNEKCKFLARESVNSSPILA